MALQDLTRSKPILKNRAPPEVEAIIVELSLDQPAYGQIRIANELRKLGQLISPADLTNGLSKPEQMKSPWSRSRRDRRAHLQRGVRRSVRAGPWIILEAPPIRAAAAGNRVKVKTRLSNCDNGFRRRRAR